MFSDHSDGIGVRTSLIFLNQAICFQMSDLAFSDMEKCSLHILLGLPFCHVPRYPHIFHGKETRQWDVCNIFPVLHERC